MTKRQHPCTKRKSHKTYSVTKTKIESTLIITFFCGVKTKFCLAKQQKSKSCHLCQGCGATIYKAYFSGFNAIFQKWFFSRHPNPKSICPKLFGYLYYKVRCVFVCPSTLKCTNVTSPQVLKLWDSQGFLWLPYDLTEVISLVGVTFKQKKIFFSKKCFMSFLPH